MKASPLVFVLCLTAIPANAGGRFGGAHAVAPHFFVNAVSDIEPGPLPPPPPAPAPPPEPERFAPPPEPVYLPQPYLAAPPVRMARPGPQIIYLRKPTSKRTGPLVIYGAG